MGGRQDADSPLGPRTLTSSGAKPALLLSTVKDCWMRARTPEPRPGPATLTLLGSTTSLAGTLKGLPVKSHRILSMKQSKEHPGVALPGQRL